MNERTFANGHGGDGTLNGILAFLAIFAVEINTELVIFALARAAYAHDNRLRMSREDRWIVSG